MDDIPLLPVRHHERHWVPDGSVVLGAVDSKKTATTLFQVHRTLLTDQSEVFASMFSLPQGEENCQTEIYGDLPVVRLPDTSEEVTALLDVLRDPLTFLERTPTSDTPKRIRPALKMASKYLMTDLRVKLVHAFESEWPLTVEDLEFKDQLLVDYFSHGNRGLRDEAGDFNGWPLHFVPEPASAIALAEEFDIQTVLAAAYYDILRCAPRSDWEDFFHESSCVAWLIGPSGKPARWTCLSAKSSQRIIYLQDVIVDETEMRFSKMEKRVCTSCRGGCIATWKRLVRESKKIPTRAQDRDLLKRFRDLRVEISQSGFCGACIDTYLELIKEQRKDFWETFQDVCWGEEYE